MLRSSILTLIFFVSSSIELAAEPLDWRVVNPFRFYKNERDFDRHRDAFERAVAQNGNTRPENAISIMERDLNAPGCTNHATPTKCAESIEGDYQNYETRRKGWAANSYSPTSNCYGNSRLSYSKTCSRNYEWGVVTEDFIRPTAHAVKIELSKQDKTRFTGRICSLQHAPISLPGAVSTFDFSCEAHVFLKTVPWPSGVRVKVFSGSDVVSEEDIVVKDRLIVGFGDSFSSGEGNPDRPIDLTLNRMLSYETFSYGLPLRYTGPQIPTPGTDSGKQLFFEHSAGWLSPDCHRSQYSYQFRVALQYAIEQKREAVTFVHLACTGAEITWGFFGPKPAREQATLTESKQVEPQIGQLLDLLCEERASPAYRFEKGQRHPFGSPTYEFRLPLARKFGNKDLNDEKFFVTGCENGKLKRPIDLVLMTFGGNDIGFSALVGYSIMKQTGSIAPIMDIIEDLTGVRYTFGPDIAQVYLGVLDKRFAELKRALKVILSVDSNRVIQSSYEWLQYAADGMRCKGKTGLDVHPEFGFIDERLRRVDDFTKNFFHRLECIADVRTGKQKLSCPRNLATGSGTGFVYVNQHQSEFARRGICAIDPDTTRQEMIFAEIPKLKWSPSGEPPQPEPWSPHSFHPYWPRYRLFVTPNDAFMSANTHLDGNSAPEFNDRANVGTAALFSGAFHRSAEAHAIVADYVFPKAKAVLSSKQ